MNATNQWNSKYFILKPAEPQTQYVLLSQFLLMVSKRYVNISFQKTTFLQQEIIRSLFLFLVACSFWSLIILSASYLTCVVVLCLIF